MGQNMIVAFATYANDYSGYVTTEMEYMVQRYEGASTLYGPKTNEVYAREFASLFRETMNGSSTTSNADIPVRNRLDYFERNPSENDGPVTRMVAPILGVEEVPTISMHEAYSPSIGNDTGISWGA